MSLFTLLVEFHTLDALLKINNTRNKYKKEAKKGLEKISPMIMDLPIIERTTRVLGSKFQNI